MYHVYTMHKSSEKICQSLFEEQNKAMINFSSRCVGFVNEMSTLKGLTF